MYLTFKDVFSLVIERTSFITALCRQRQVKLCEFLASMVYVYAVLVQVWTHSESLPQKQSKRKHCILNDEMI